MRSLGRTMSQHQMTRLNMTLSSNRIPVRVYSRTTLILGRYQRGVISPRTSYQHGYISLRINHRWRLSSKDGGMHWVAMSHEKYNKQLRGWKMNSFTNIRKRAKNLEERNMLRRAISEWREALRLAESECDRQECMDGMKRCSELAKYSGVPDFL